MPVIIINRRNFSVVVLNAPPHYSTTKTMDSTKIEQELTPPALKQPPLTLMGMPSEIRIAVIKALFSGVFLHLVSPPPIQPQPAGISNVPTNKPRSRLALAAVNTILREEVLHQIFDRGTASVVCDDPCSIVCGRHGTRSLDFFIRIKEVAINIREIRYVSPGSLQGMFANLERVSFDLECNFASPGVKKVAGKEYNFVVQMTYLAFRPQSIHIGRVMRQCKFKLDLIFKIRCCNNGDEVGLALNLLC